MCYVRSLKLFLCALRLLAGDVTRVEPRQKYAAYIWLVSCHRQLAMVPDPIVANDWRDDSVVTCNDIYLCTVSQVLRQPTLVAGIAHVAMLLCVVA